MNTHADLLATLATSIGESLSRIIMVENLETLSYVSHIPIGKSVVHVNPSWMHPVVTFIKDGMLPKDRTEAEKVQRKASRYLLLEEQKLYK